MTPNIRFSESDRITIHNEHFRVVRQSSDGIVFEAINQADHSVSYRQEEIGALLASPDCVLEQGFFNPCQAETRISSPADRMSDLPEHIRSNVLWKKAYCDVFLACEAEGSVSRIEADVSEKIANFERQVNEIDARCQSIGCAARAGAKRTFRKPPCAKSLLNWVRPYERADCSPLALIPKTHLGGNRSDRFDFATEELLAIGIADYATLHRRTMDAVVKSTTDRFEAENTRRNAAGIPPLAIPSKRTIKRRIKALDPYYIHLKRFGAAAANRKFTLYETGVETLHPMERIEVDEWQIDLYTVFSQSGALAGLSQEQRDALEKGRRWLCVAIDCATRCILAMHLADTPSSAAALQTLKQIVSDKGKIAAAAGCKSSWGQCGRPGTIVCDLGAAFIAEQFRTAVLDLGGTIEHPPGGLPWLRGSIERMFRTYGTVLMRELSGQTFSNPQDRGDYPTEQLACHTDDSLMEVLVRFVVDIYHNTPHAGLKGETPSNCWNRLADKYGVRSKPCGLTLRAVLGQKMTRRVSGKGVLAFGIDYSCEALRHHYLHSHETTVTIGVDTSDLGWIAVLIDGKWHPARALQSGFDDVSLAEWTLIAQQLRVKHAGEAAVHQATIAAAFKHISQVDRAALERMHLSMPVITDADFRREHDRLFLGLTIVPDRATTIPDPGADLFGDVIEPDKPAPIQNGDGHSSENDERTTKESPPNAPRWRLEDD